MQQKTAPVRVAFLLDVDNTLLDNDALKAHLQSQMLEIGGDALAHRFWELYEEVRVDLDAVSVPVTLERLRQEAANPETIDGLGERLFDSPFASFVYAGVPDLLHWMRDRGIPVILSDGDPWFQAKKVTDAGLGAAVRGNVLIFLHKEAHVAEIARWYPADRYVAVDDKAHLLALLKRNLGDRLTTVWVRQGHYAQASSEDDTSALDYCVAAIGDVRAVLEQALTN